MAAAGFILLA